MYDGHLGRMLTNPNGLDMVETVSHSNGHTLLATYFHETKLIDAVLVTKDLAVANACAMPMGYGIGDHCAFIVDFHLALMVGLQPQPIK